MFANKMKYLIPKYQNNLWW